MSIPLANRGWLSHKTGERMTEPLLLHIEGAIATITFNRPERRNAITFDMWNHLQRLCLDVKGNPHRKGGGPFWKSVRRSSAATEPRARE